MLYFKAFLLSIIQSLTDFIPVSSSGHLIIFGNYLNFNNSDTQLFETSIQLASILAVSIFFRKKLLNVVLTIHKDKNSRNFIYKFIIAFLPTAIVGLIFYKYIKIYLQNNLIVAISLIVGGIIFIIVNKLKIKETSNNLNEVSKKNALKIGISQIFSMIPGVSRSGSTIIGGLLFGLSRKVAVEFSFILAIPTILAATIFDLYKNLNKINYSNISILLFGFIVTFISSMLVIKWFLKYISEHNFNIFGYYRIILGIVIILIYYV